MAHQGPYPRKGEMPFSHTAGQEKDRSSKEQKEKLTVPMDEYRAEVVECVRANENAVIIGDTGSGKTTRIPDFLLDQFPQAKIAITQPRRVAARSVAKFVANQRKSESGKGEVGYQVRFEDETTEGTRATFMTDGILLRKLTNDPLLRMYDVVMVDEAHERSLNIDFVLGLLKKAQTERKKAGLKELKVVAASATIEKEKFARYFGEAPVVEVPGRMFPVEVHYEPVPIHDCVKAAAWRVGEIVRSGGAGDVLIFMPGEGEIQKTMSEIRSLGLTNIDVMPLFGSMPPEDQDRIFAPNSKRKVIVSTNIAETSLTIDGVRFVIDSGLVKETEFDPSTGIQSLVTKIHAKSGGNQRKGRAGRTAPGVCYRLFTEQQWNDAPEFQTAEILRSNLDHVILAMKKIGIENVRGFDFIDKPELESVQHAFETLTALGALDEQEQLTHMGEMMADLPLRPEMARMVIESQKYGCVESVITVAAMMGGKSVFVRPRERQDEADRAHAAFRKPGSDFLTMLEVWKRWEQSGFNRSWAHQNFLHAGQLGEVGMARAQLMRELKNKGIAVTDTQRDPKNIEKSIAAGLIQHLATPGSRSNYFPVSGKGRETYVHPSSSVFGMDANVLIAADVMETTRVFARQCQVVDPAWLPDIAPHLLREERRHTFYDPKTAEVMERVDFSLKRSYGTITSTEQKATDSAQIVEALAAAMMQGTLPFPGHEKNTQTWAMLNELSRRSGGMIAVPDLKSFYKEQLGKMADKKDAQTVEDRLTLSAETFCSADQHAQIDRFFPLQMEVRGVPCDIRYDYSAPNPEAYYESEQVGRYDAVITVPFEEIFRLTESQFVLPWQNAEGKKPATRFKTERPGGAYNGLFSTLDELKANIDHDRVEAAWRSFGSSEKKEDVVPTSVAWFEMALNGHEPIVYAQTYKGEPQTAYPAIGVEQRYNYSRSVYDDVYVYRYARTKDEAQTTTNSAQERWKQTQESLRLEEERKTLAEPAKQRLEELKKTVSMVWSSSYQRPNSVSILLRDAEGALGNYQNNPRRAMEFMDQLEVKIETVREGERKNDEELVHVKDRLTHIDQKMGEMSYFNYQDYGLTYEQFNNIAVLRSRVREGISEKKPAEQVGEWVEELMRLLPTGEKVSPEQRGLIELLSGRDGHYAQFVRVRGGRVTESAPPQRRTETIAAPTELPIGGSGRTLRIQGNRVWLVYASGNPGDAYVLPDGDYVIGRDVAPVVRVEERVDQAYGLQAFETLRPDMRHDVWGREENRSNHGKDWNAITPTHVIGAEQKTSGLGGAFDALKNVSLEGGVLKPATASSSTKPEAIIPKEKFVVTEEKQETLSEDGRGQLQDRLREARVFIDHVRSVPEPSDKRQFNGDKISKTRQKAQDLKRDLASLDEELRTSMNAERMRSKVNDISRRAESLANEMARNRLEREDWTTTYKEYVMRLKELAQTLEMDLTEMLQERMVPSVITLAKRTDAISDVDAELESVLLDLI